MILYIRTRYTRRPSPIIDPSFGLLLSFGRQCDFPTARVTPTRYPRLLLEESDRSVMGTYLYSPLADICLSIGFSKIPKARILEISRTRKFARLSTNFFHHDFFHGQALDRADVIVRLFHCDSKNDIRGLIKYTWHSNQSLPRVFRQVSELD